MGNQPYNRPEVSQVVAWSQESICAEVPEQKEASRILKL